MQWLLAHTINNSVYWELEGVSKKTVFRFNHHTQSFRIQMDFPKLFSIEKEKKLIDSFSFYASFNQLVGSYFKDKLFSGTITVEGKRFTFHINGNIVQLINKKENLNFEFSIRDMQKMSNDEFAAICFSSIIFNTTPIEEFNSIAKSHHLTM